MILAKRIIFDNGAETPKVILCLIEQESENFLIVRTGSSRVYTINKKKILSISETNQEFIDNYNTSQKVIDGAKQTPSNFINNKVDNKESEKEGF
jgi:hypothetical protein